MSEELTASLWQRMADLHPFRWIPGVGEWSPDSPAVKAWASALRGITGAMLARGLQAWVRKGQAWPPSAGEFRVLCVSDGLPDFEAALQEGRTAARGNWSAHAWSHPVVYVMAYDIGTWNFQQMLERDLQKAARVAYDRACTRWRNGDDLTAPQPLRLEAPPKRPPNPDLAAKHMTDLAALLERTEAKAAAEAKAKELDAQRATGAAPEGAADA